MAAQWVGLPYDPTRMETELHALATRLARDLERSEEGRNAAVREGYELRETLTRLAAGIRQLAAHYELSDLHREMVRYLLTGPPDPAEG